MISRSGLDTDSVSLSGRARAHPKLDKDGHPIKILCLSKAHKSGRGPSLNKTYLRSDEQGIVRTKTAEEVHRVLQSR